MKVEQIYTGCLAEAAYYIESNGEAAIVDPLREVAPYIEMAESHNAKIKYVLETHFHADFVSGHIDLANKTGAKIVFGPNAAPNYDAYIAKDEEILPLGDIKIKVLHTPGHTMESTTYLLIDEEGKEHAIFTGDTLFIGDVGRPDLAVKTDLSREDLAGHLYESLRNKIMTLPDDVIVYPGHGAGSACGKNMSSETVDTLGNQKLTNYALKADMTKDEFIKEVTEGLVDPPQYFPKNAVMNKMGYDSFDEVLNQGNTPLSAKEFETVANSTGAIVLDTRHQDEYAKEHIPGSIFIGIDDNFAPWVGALIVDLKQAIVFIAEEGREEEVVTRLSRVGYDNTLGYLKGGIAAWKEAGFDIDTIDQTTAFEFEKGHKEDYELLDVRKESEYESQHVVGFKNFPLDFINRNMAELDRDKGYYLHCQGGYR
jgi:glyoxylase-like metal-dependent hydrolase (beta-lactamase superfamily II)/rhodanese-related sulfurtransferase